MNRLILYIRDISDGLAENYSLDLRILFAIYLISYVPFYLGYFLMVYGSTRKLSWKDFFRLKIRGKFQWNNHVTLGFLIHLFGRIMPYIYITFWGKDLPIWILIILYSIILFSILLFIRKVFLKKNTFLDKEVNIFRKDSIGNEDEIDILWNIYDNTFEPINKISPCKQSLDYEHFIYVLKDTSVRKYLINKNNYGLIGLGLVTSSFKHIPWISENYFKFKFPNQYTNNTIYYFMGLAISNNFRGNKYSISLLEQIIDDLPHDVVLGFDHSYNINPILHYFTKIVRQSISIQRTHIDCQHYHVVEWKK